MFFFFYEFTVFSRYTTILVSTLQTIYNLQNFWIPKPLPCCQITRMKFVHKANHKRGPGPAKGGRQCPDTEILDFTGGK